MDSTVPVNFQEYAFKTILSQAGNHTCADCPTPGPDWASLNLGIFICFKCSGIHRGLGLHITRVKSTKLDSWTLKQMFMMNFVNNQETNSYWEAKLPDESLKPSTEASTEELKSFIYDKYVHKKYVSLESKSPFEEVVEKLNLGTDMGDHETKDHYFQRKLRELEEMLKAKSIISSRNPILPFGSITKDKKIQQPFGLDTLKAIKASKNYKQRLASNPDMQLVGPTFQDKLKEGRKRGANSSQFDQLALFEGLTVKAAGATPKSSNTPFNFSSNAHGLGHLHGHLNHSPQRQRHGNNKNLARAATFNSGGDGELYHPYQQGTELEMLDISHISYKNEQKENDEEEEHVGYLSKIKSINLLEEENSDEGEDEKPKQLKKPLIAEKVKSSNLLGDYTPKSRLLDNCYSLHSPDINLNKPRTYTKLPSISQDFGHLYSTGKGSRTHLDTRADKYPKWIVLFGCVFFHLAFGYLYSWGSISPYIAHFFTKTYLEPYYLDVASYSSLVFLGFTLGYLFSEKLINLMGFRKSALVCFVSAFLMLLLCSYAIAPMVYSSIPTFVTGLFLGLAYNIPYYCAIQYFSDYPSHLRGFLYLIDSIGGFYFSYACYSYLNSFINLDNRPNDETDEEYYPHEIRDLIPDFIVYIGTTLLVMGLIGTIAIKPKANFVERDWTALRDRGELLLRSRRSTIITLKRNKGPKSRDLKHALISPAAKFLFQIITFSSVLGSFYLYAHKMVGLQLGYSDSFLSVVGGLGIIAMGLGKVGAIICFKKYGFKVCLIRVFFAQAVLGVAAVVLYDWFLLYYIPIMFMSGFIESLVREEVSSKYSEEIESSMVGLMMLGFVVSKFMSFTIVKIGDYFLSYRLLNLFLIIPLWRAYIMEKKYAGEMRNRTSVSESEIARILAD